MSTQRKWQDFLNQSIKTHKEKKQEIDRIQQGVYLQDETYNASLCPTNLTATGNFPQLALVGGCDENVEDDCCAQQETVNEMSFVEHRKRNHEESFIVKSETPAYRNQRDHRETRDHREMRNGGNKKDALLHI